jgi:hypothetical protein
VKLVLKTQFSAISFSLFWIIYLNILAFFDQPERGLQYINWLVYGFAALFGIVSMLLTKHFLGGNWIALPLVLIPEFIIYQPIFDRYFLILLPTGFKSIFHFLSLSTGMIYLIAILLGLILGIMFGRAQKA